MKFRRVVTANDQEGKSYAKWDGDIEAVPVRPGFSRYPMWATKKLPAERTEEDAGKWEVGGGASIGGGSVFRLIQYDPGVAQRWTRTETIDYCIIVSGEIDMQLDKGEVHLKAGDVLVQKETIHLWQNRGSEPCVMLFVLLPVEGGKSTG